MAQQVIVAGGGIIGASCAYYLAQNGLKPVVIEACTPACSASGKAGGFLALDWCDSSALGPLARRSYALHAELAETLGKDCGYRNVMTHSLSVKVPVAGKSNSQRKAAPPLPDWVDTAHVKQSSVIGNVHNTAQVNPKMLTMTLLERVKESGGSVMERTQIIGLETTPEGGEVAGVIVQNLETKETSVIATTSVVLALGVWSSTVNRILGREGTPSSEISGLKVHSIVIDDANGVASADALFLSYTSPDGILEPEIYPRPDKTVYVCGVSSEEPPPALADDIKPRSEAITTLKEVVNAVVPTLSTAPVRHEQACFLPCSEDGLPFIGPIPDLKGAYIATGHSCWGILNGPATGLAVAELIVSGESTSVDISAFDPGRNSPTFSLRR